MRGTGGGGGGDHPDPEIRGMRGLKEKFVPPFGPQFCLKIRRGWPPPLPSLGRGGERGGKGLATVI